MNDTPSSHPDLAEQFPTTLLTMLSRLLKEGEEEFAEAHRHVMEVYAQPLATYVGRSRSAIWANRPTWSPGSSRIGCRARVS